MDWISVSDRLPDELKQVIVYIRDPESNRGCRHIGWLSDGMWLAESMGLVTVSHWMPLPEPPPDTDNLIEVLIRLRMRYGSPLPQPLRVGKTFFDSLGETILSASGKNPKDMPSVSDAKVFGISVVLDEDIPENEMCVFYRDAKGKLRVLRMVNMEDE